MRSRLTSALAVLGAIALLLVAGNTAAYAATGHAFILGHSNTSKAKSTLSRTKTGPVLGLHAHSSSSAPFTTNATGKVANLNADKVDGYDSSQMVNRTYVYEDAVSSVSAFSKEIPVPAGSYQFAYSAYLSGATTDGYCYLEQANGSSYKYVGLQYQTGTAYGLSGAGVVTKDSGGHLYVYCYSPGTWSTPSEWPLQVTMTPTSIVGGGTSSLRVGAKAPARINLR